jgi:hypothetical protein
MVGKNRESGVNERLDRVGREMVRASAANEAEAEAAASSPFLYARLRTRIEAERQRREQGEGWFALFGVMWRAVPAMALVAFFAFTLFWTASLSGGTPTGFSVESLLNTRDAGIEHVVFEDRQPLSSDEVLATILDDGQEASK